MANYLHCMVRPDSSEHTDRQTTVESKAVIF